jgi:CMP/dCMP kinase
VVTAEHPFIIAIDGHSASGKGTLSRRLGKELGYPVLDTGLLYRAVGWLVLQSSGNLNDEKDALHAADKLHEFITGDILSNPGLREFQTDNAASVVSAYPSVRQSLFNLQRNFALHPPNNAKGAILDGRDIGTVICPDAAVKFFVTASAEIRAERRAKDSYGTDWTKYYPEVLEKTKERDKRDSERPTAPLIPAHDAIILDSTHDDAEAILGQALAAVHSRLRDIQ